jgi:hypothetical protein
MVKSLFKSTLVALAVTTTAGTTLLNAGYIPHNSTLVQAQRLIMHIDQAYWVDAEGVKYPLLTAPLDLDIANGGSVDITAAINWARELGIVPQYLVVESRRYFEAQAMAFLELPEIEAHTLTDYLQVNVGDIRHISLAALDGESPSLQTCWIPQSNHIDTRLQEAGIALGENNALLFSLDVRELFEKDVQEATVEIVSGGIEFGTTEKGHPVFVVPHLPALTFVEKIAQPEPVIPVEEETDVNATTDESTLSTEDSASENEFASTEVTTSAETQKESTEEALEATEEAATTLDKEEAGGSEAESVNEDDFAAVQERIEDEGTAEEETTYAEGSLEEGVIFEAVTEVTEEMVTEDGDQVETPVVEDLQTLITTIEKPEESVIIDNIDLETTQLSFVSLEALFTDENSVQIVEEAPAVAIKEEAEEKLFSLAMDEIALTAQTPRLVHDELTPISEAEVSEEQELIEADNQEENLLTLALVERAELVQAAAVPSIEEEVVAVVPSAEEEETAQEEMHILPVVEIAQLSSVQLPVVTPAVITPIIEEELNEEATEGEEDTVASLSVAQLAQSLQPQPVICPIAPQLDDEEAKEEVVAQSTEESFAETLIV